jgi:hypothetical protein
VLDEAVEDDMIVDYDVPVGGYAVCDIILRRGYAVGVIILLISPTTKSALFPT